jgi:hypothetical protein
MLKVQKQESLYCPFIFCDVCGEKIEDYSFGVVVYPALSESETTEVIFAHKGICHENAEEKIVHMGNDAGYEEINNYFRYLSRNGAYHQSLSNHIPKVQKSATMKITETKGGINDNKNGK